MNYTGFPTIKVGRFYKLQFNRSKVVAFCAAPDKFIVSAGSTLDMRPWPNCLVKEKDRDTPWDNALFELAACDIMERPEHPPYIAVFGKDYDKANPLEIAQMATGDDNADPAKLWQEVFA